MLDPFESRLARELEARLVEEIGTLRNGSRINWDSPGATAQNYVHADGKVQGLEIARKLLLEAHDAMTEKPKREKT